MSEEVKDTEKTKEEIEFDIKEQDVINHFARLAMTDAENVDMIVKHFNLSDDDMVPLRLKLQKKTNMIEPV